MNGKKCQVRKHYLLSIPTTNIVEGDEYYIKPIGQQEADIYKGGPNNTLLLIQQSGINNYVFEAGENINSHTPVVLKDNLLYKLDSLNQEHKYCFLGFTKTSAILGSFVEVEQNKITLPSWGLIAGENYLAGPNGSMILQNNLPNSFTQVIGKAMSTDTLLIYKFFNPIIKN